MRIKIGEPYIEESGDFRRLKARISIPTEAAEKWQDYSKAIYSQWRLEEDWPPECWKEPDFSLWFGIENKWRNAFLGKKQGKGHTYPFPSLFNMGVKAVCRSCRAAEESDMP